MIKSFEELGDVLAEFENRIKTLENSMPFYEVEPEPKEVKVEHHHYNHSLSKKEWDDMEQTRLRTIHLEKRIKQLQDKKMVDKQYRYK